MSDQRTRGTETTSGPEGAHQGAGIPPAAAAVAETFPLGLHWPTVDPFLFVAHHRDDYPAGTEEMSPAEPLGARQIGSDFSGLNGWSMYHGDRVPGFPSHPHRGFETITYVRQGLVDHSDSLGATARFGRGDTQWLTTGAGVVHSEMFPLVNRDRRNPTELFQIWLNLPAQSKFANPYFTMFWADSIPRIRPGSGVSVTVIAGSLPGAGTEGVPPTPPPDSWASRDEAEIAVWHVVMEGGSRWELPGVTRAGTRRMLYVFDGGPIEVSGTEVRAGTGARPADGRALELVAGPGRVELLLLQGRPIGEPVARYGPFVMTTRSEIMDAMEDYQRTQFGGWPWGSAGPVHPVDRGRFAIHPDGREETPADRD